MHLPSAFDFAVVAVVLISAGIAFARGFVREVLSVSAFIAAALAALWASPSIAPAVADVIHPNWVALFIVVVGIFMAVFVGVTVVTHALTSMLHRSDQVGIVDRVLGMGFGAGRGVLLLALFLVLYQLAIGSPALWMTENSYSFPLIHRTSAALQQLAPAGSRASGKPAVANGTSSSS
jgi:membrane protein required for colicin V production